jgi:hypothetical protein
MKFGVIVMSVAVALLLAVAGCQTTASPMPKGTPLEVPSEAHLGEYITVRVGLESEQPCRLILATEHQTGVDNYLSPAKKLTYPDNNNVVVMHEQVPWDLVPGVYVLRVVQMRYDGDTEGAEIVSQTFMVTPPE